MTLVLHRSDRADALAQTLAGVLAQAPGDPFTREVIAVPTRGQERWLTQTLSGTLGARPGHTDGVCAAVDFPSPGRVLAGALAAGSGIDPDSDPWTAGRTVWPLLEIVERRAGEPWLERLARRIAEHPEGRFARLERLAALFDRYGLWRPELLQAWAAGEDPHWQAELWRALRAELDLPSPAERLPEALVALRREPERLELPGRLFLFGLTQLPVTHLRLLTAIAEHRDVHLLLLHPSASLWAQTLAAVPEGSVPGPRRLDPTVHLPRNRLLASWGRDVRELGALLAGALRSESTGNGAQRGTGTLLARLQADVVADRAPDGRMVLAPGDDSVRVHACHGRARQVQVLREAILHRLAADPTLEPRDVIVMCPDVEAFAPLIGAEFGIAEATAGELRVRLADRSLRRTNPLLAVLARLLDLAGRRASASEILDLIDAGPIRLRFGLRDESLAQIREWVAAAGINWGLDTRQRARFRMGEIEAGTWAAGLRRLLLGVALPAGGATRFGAAAPAAEIDSGQIELVGRLAELIDRLGTAFDTLTGPLTVAGWARALAGAVDALTATAPSDGWQRQELANLLDDLVRESGDPQVPIGPAEIGTLLGDRLRGRPTRANFRTGHLTVCTLMPMRSVPHRVVCLLGLDDQSFPRHGARDGDDLLLEDPRVGERDPRAEDRQLLLDALLAAQDALIVTYTGNDERTNAPRPPAVPIGELLDAVDATAQLPDGRPARTVVRVAHPLQPFHPRNFTPGGVVAGGPWSFDALALAGARTLTLPKQDPPLLLRGPLPPPADQAALALDDLVAFVCRPDREFLRQRLGISLGAWDDELRDGLPVTFDGLDRHRVGERLLAAMLAGADPEGVLRAEIARGKLPPGGLGYPVLKGIWQAAQQLLHAAARFAGEPRTLQANTVLAGGLRLTGTVAGVRDGVLVSVGYARLNARHRLAAWVRLLALTAAHPEEPWKAVTLGRSSRRGAAVALAELRPLGRSAEDRRLAAVTVLEDLVALRTLGLREPLGLPALSAAAWVTALRDGEDPQAAAQTEWTSGWTNGRRVNGEDADPEHARLHGGVLPLASIERHAPGLWEPLLARETLEYR